MNIWMKTVLGEDGDAFVFVIFFSVCANKTKARGNFIIISPILNPSNFHRVVYCIVSTESERARVNFIRIDLFVSCVRKFNDISNPYPRVCLDLWPSCMPICFVLSSRTECLMQFLKSSLSNEQTTKTNQKWIKNAVRWRCLCEITNQLSLENEKVYRWLMP